MTSVLWNLVLVCFEMVLVMMEDRCPFSLNVPLAQKLFWTNQIVLLGDDAQLGAHFGPFGDNANLNAR
jgi:hypothetical protein